MLSFKNPVSVCHPFLTIELEFSLKNELEFNLNLTSPLVFDVFVGQASGDFGPKFEQLDKLKIGEEITVYYDDKTPLQKNQDLRFLKEIITASIGFPSPKAAYIKAYDKS